MPGQKKIKPNRFRTAIVGMGKMGKIRKRELDSHASFEIVALSDINNELEIQYPVIPFYTNWKDLMALDLDVIFVCTYNKIAPDIVCTSLNNNINVFCEKPPGTTVNDVKKIIKAEKKARGRVLKFGFNHRFHYSIIEAKSIIDSKRFGKILNARGIYGKAGGIDYENSWRLNETVSGGGILLDQGIHLLDLMRYLIGDFVEVKSFIENHYWKKSSLEDNAFIIMKTADDKVAMVHSSATHWKHKFSLEIFLEDGYIYLNGLLTSTRSYGEERITFAKKQFEDETLAFGRPREETIFYDKDDSWKLELDEFYKCLMNRHNRPNGNSSDALKVMELLEKIYQSGKN